MAELCSHQVNAANWFLGSSPDAVIASGGLYRFPENREVYDHVYVTFEYPGGRTAVFSSIESNAFDDYYEMYLGTKGTLIMLREREALLFEEGGSGRQTGIEVTPAGKGAAAQSSETMAANTNQGCHSSRGTIGGGRPGGAAIRDAAADAAVLLGDSRRHAAGLRSRQGHRLRTRLHWRERGDQDQGACQPADDLGPDARSGTTCRSGATCSHPRRGCGAWRSLICFWLRAGVTSPAPGADRSARVGIRPPRPRPGWRCVHGPRCC